MTDLGIPGVGDATLIASGGSALVYKAMSGTGEQLAVKVLRGIRGQEVTRRFDREQSAAERLRGHPNIMRIHHSGVTAAGEPYLVMPLIEGGSLNDELDRNGAFTLSQATSDIAAAADALHYAHEQGVLHRDIKPGNLLRDTDGAVIVTDFGIARVKDAGIASSTVGATTPLYAAPEILAENEASVRSEVYALAATLYALLAGEPAFAGTDNIWATMNRIRTEDPADIAGVPAPVMRVIQQSMSKDPSLRPSTAERFRENLRLALTSGPDWRPAPETTELPREETLAALAKSGATADAPPTIEARRPIVPHDEAVKVDDLPPLSTPAVTVPQSDSATPPAPAFNRPAPAVGEHRTPVDIPQNFEQPRREGLAIKAVMVVGALLLLAGLAWFGANQLFSGNDLADEANLQPPVDNSLPSPDNSSTDTSVDDAPPDEAEASGDDAAGSEGTSGEPQATDQSDEPAESEDAGSGGVDIEDLPEAADVPNTFVRFTGDHFTALLPEGWTVSAADIEESYGFRSVFVGDGMYLNIDTTPKEQRTPGLDIAQGARDIAAGIGSASEVRTEEVEGLTMHSFTFRNNQGVDSIDIFFEVDGDGYAVVAGSASDPDTAFATARLVALSIRSNA